MLFWNGIFVLLSAFSSLTLDVYLFDTEQEHEDVRVQLIHPLQLDGTYSTKRCQDLEWKTRLECHPHLQLHDTFVSLHSSQENLQSL